MTKKSSKESAADATKRRFLTTLRKKLGIVSLACSLESIEEEVYRGWIRDDPEFARKVEECKETTLDFVEARMFERIDKGDARLIRFFLETKGKERGYVLRHEIDNVSMPQIVLTPEEALMIEKDEDLNGNDVLPADNPPENEPS